MRTKAMQLILTSRFAPFTPQYRSVDRVHV